VVFFERKMTSPNSDIMKKEIINRLINNLERKNFKVVVLNKIDEIKIFIKNTIPESSSIGFGDSVNYNIVNLLKEKGNKVLSNWKIGITNRTLDTFEEFPKPDYYFSNVKAISDEGLIVDFEGMDNQHVSEETFPQHIIAFAAINKILKNIDDVTMKFKDSIQNQLQNVVNKKPEKIDFTIVLIPN
jgi:hypothetical protein